MGNLILGFQGQYRFLADFWEVQVYLEGDDKPYPSVENAFQASKTENLELRERIRNYHPHKVKRFGEETIDQIDWLDNEVSAWWNDETLVKTMKELLLQKFDCRDIELVQKLLATGDATIVAPSYQDSLGFDTNRPGDSYNTKGKLLMEVREVLVSEKAVIHNLLKYNTSSKEIALKLGISEKMLSNKKRAYDLLYIRPDGNPKQSADWDDALLFIEQNPTTQIDGFPFSVAFPRMYGGQEYEIITVSNEKHIARVDASRQFMSEGLEWTTLGANRDGNKERALVVAWKLIEK